jgi:hypothetical protein
MVSAMMKGAGFDRISFTRFDTPICIGLDLDEAVRFALDVGPAGEIMRLAEDAGTRLRPEVETALRRRFETMMNDDGGVYAESSVWIVNAMRPR